MLFSLLIRFFLIACLSFLCFFPNLKRFGEQVSRWENFNALVKTDFEGKTELQKQFTQFLLDHEGMLQKSTAKQVEAFILESIEYTNDWDQWTNFDYWPEVEEIWQRKKEDCDGQAILAASLLRILGEEAQVIGNFQHIWVKSGDEQILGPQKEVTIEQDGERSQFKWPSYPMLKNTTYFFLPNFPAYRLLLLAFLSLLVCSLPRPSLKNFIIPCLCISIQYVLLVMLTKNKVTDDILFLGLLGCLLLTFLYSYIKSRKPIEKSSQSQSLRL